MKFDRRQAKTLSTQKELELFDNARSPKLNKLTPAELRRMVKRSRTLRDKLVDVKRKEIRSTQAKASQRGKKAADRTVEKAKLYSEVHNAFVKRLSSVEKEAAAKLAKKKTPSKKAPAKGLASAATGKGKTPDGGKSRSPKATTASKAAIDFSIDIARSPQALAERTARRGKVVGTRIAKGGSFQKHSHASSLNKRNQGKRDARGGRP